MDCRKLLWLGGLVVGGLVGCSRHETVANADPYNSSPPVGRSGSNSDPTQPVVDRRRKEPAESKELDGKPTSLVKIAEVQSGVALDEANAPEQRQAALAKAKENYRRAVQMDPKCLSAYVGMARLCGAAGEHEQAVHALDAGLAKFPQNASLWHERGMAMGRQKQFDEAAKSLHRATQIEPDNKQYAKDLGLMLARAGKAEDGAAWLRRTMSEADARYNVARMMRHIGQADEGQHQLELALKADPAHAASVAMATEGRSGPTSDESLQLAGHTEEAPAPAAAPALRIIVDAPSPTADSLPQRPAEPPARRPAVQIGFDPNP